MKANSVPERLFNGVIKENPTLVLALGMCPTLAVTTSAMNGLGMGLTTTAVLAMSNLIISLLRKFIPNRVRIPAFIVIVASFVTIVQLLLEAYLPSLNVALGVYIPLIVVNCIILGRAESYAYHNPPIPSLFDGLGMGIGFSIALTMIGAVREILGTGSVFGYHVLPSGYVNINIFVLAPGAFFVLAMLTALQNFIKNKMSAKGKDVSKIGSGCSEDCASCSDTACGKRFYDNTIPVKSVSKPKEEKAEVKAEEKSEEKAVEKNEEKQPEKTETKAEENITEEKTEDKPEEKAEEKSEVKSEEKSEENAEEKAEDMPEEKTEEGPEEKSGESEVKEADKPSKDSGKKDGGKKRRKKR